MNDAFVVGLVSIAALGGAAVGGAQAGGQAQSSPWEQKFSEQHRRPYWVHRQTKESTWTNPNPQKVRPAAGGQGRRRVKWEGEWEEKFSDKHSRKYWVHRTTKESTWTQPVVKEEFVNPLRQRGQTIEVEM